MFAILFTPSVRAGGGPHSLGGRLEIAPGRQGPPRRPAPRVTPAPPPAPIPSPRPPTTIPSAFRINEYAPPPPNQMGTGRCLYFASTGIAEWLYGRAKCKKGKVGGAGDFSEKAFYEGNHYTSKPFTDTPLDFPHTGYVPDSEFKFNGRVDGYLPAGLRARRDVPAFDRKVLFDYHRPDRGDPWAPSGRMKDGDVEKIKAALVKYQSPILFMYTPTRIVNGRPQAIASYWHANYIVGWNADGFIVRDSAFGAADTSVPRDPTGQYRLKPTLMPYALFKASGKSAAVYHLKQDPGCRDATPVAMSEDVTPMDPAKYPIPDTGAKRAGNASGVNEYRNP